MKENLRLEFKKLRNDIEDKTLKDERICINFLNSKLYQNAEVVLCYYPLSNEISTIKIIKTCFKDNKKIALPVCLENNKIGFYYINNLDDVAKGKYDIMEPLIKRCEKVTDFGECVLIVPGLAFDIKGYRLGYGKGYYDRFLSENKILTVGFCYNKFIVNELPINQFDKKVEYICSENGLCSL